MDAPRPHLPRSFHFASPHRVAGGRGPKPAVGDAPWGPRGPESSVVPAWPLSSPPHSRVPRPSVSCGPCGFPESSRVFSVYNENSRRTIRRRLRADPLFVPLRGSDPTRNPLGLCPRFPHRALKPLGISGCWGAFCSKEVTPGGPLDSFRSGPVTRKLCHDRKCGTFCPRPRRKKGQRWS